MPEQVHGIWPLLYGLQTNELARVIIAALLEFVFDSIAQASPSPGSHATRLVQIDARCNMPPQPFSPSFSLSPLLGLVERMRRIGCDVIDDEGLVLGRIADSERRRLLFGEEREDAVHSDTGSVCEGVLEYLGTCSS